MPGTAESDGEKLARMGTDAALWARDLRSAIIADAQQEARKAGGMAGAPLPTVALTVALTAEPGQVLHRWLCAAIEAGRAAGAAEVRREWAESLPLLVQLHAGELAQTPIKDAWTSTIPDSSGGTGFTVDRVQGELSRNTGTGAPDAPAGDVAAARDRLDESVRDEMNRRIAAYLDEHRASIAAQLRQLNEAQLNGHVQVCIPDRLFPSWAVAGGRFMGYPVVAKPLGGWDAVVVVGAWAPETV